MCAVKRQLCGLFALCNSYPCECLKFIIFHVETERAGCDYPAR